MKKLLALLLSIIMLMIPMAAFAATGTTANVDYVKNEITIADSFATEHAGRIATLVIVNPGKDLANFADDGVIAWADQDVIATDGSFEFAVDMTHAVLDGEYKFYVAVSGIEDSFEGAFNYSKGEIDNALLSSIADETLRPAGMDLFIRETAANRIGQLDEDLVKDYINLKNETKVAQAMIGARPFADMEAFAEKLRTEVDAQKKAEKTSGGGGGGGGFGGGNTLIVDPPLITPEKPANTNPFYDVADNYWGKDAILGLYAKDIVKGQGDGFFRPNNTITRAEFVQMVVKAFGFGMKGEAAQFTDVKNTDWFSNAVQIAYTNGVVNGTSETTFSPNRNITRQDMMTILNNAAKATGVNLTSADATFTDAKDISAYAKDAVSAMVGSKVVSGYTDGSVKPLNNASRAEAAAMLSRLLEVK